MARDQFFSEGVQRRWQTFIEDYEQITNEDGMPNMWVEPAGLLQAFEKYIKDQRRSMPEALEIIGLTREEYATLRREAFLHGAKCAWDDVTSGTPYADKYRIIPEEAREEVELFDKEADADEREIFADFERAQGNIRTPHDRLKKEGNDLAMTFFEGALSETGLSREEALKELGLTEQEITTVKENYTTDCGIDFDDDSSPGPRPEPPTAG